MVFHQIRKEKEEIHAKMRKGTYVLYSGLNEKYGFIISVCKYKMLIKLEQGFS